MKEEITEQNQEKYYQLPSFDIVILWSFSREAFSLYWVRVFPEIYGQNAYNSHSCRCCSYSY